MPSMTNDTGINRRHFLAAAGTGSALGALPLANAQSGPAARVTSGIVDCQSHLFSPEAIELMRKRKTDPLVYDRDGTTYSSAVQTDCCSPVIILGYSPPRSWSHFEAYISLPQTKRKSSPRMLSVYFNYRNTHRSGIRQNSPRLAHGLLPKSAT